MHRLIEKVELHDELNPKIWDGTELRPEVHEALDDIVDQFILEMDENEIPVKVLDARLVGSNASFNYTENSDLDVHLVVNMEETSCDVPVLSLLYNYFKKNFNDKYNISIHGIPVELYVEDMNSSAVSNGIYSLFKDEWIKFPEPIEIPDIDITDAFAPYEERYNKIMQSGNDQGAEELIDELYLLRKDSIATEGEYGVGNLVFKEFRNKGYLDNLKQLMTDITSKELSVEALTEALSDDTYYRVDVQYGAGGTREGVFSALASIVEYPEIDADIRENLDNLSLELGDILGPAPDIDEPKAIFAYKKKGLQDSLETLNKIERELKKIDSLDYLLIISELGDIGEIVYEDEYQVAYIPKSASVISKEAITETLTEAKADQQKLVDHVGQELADRFFNLRNKIKAPQNDLYYWLKRTPEELEDFLSGEETKKSNNQVEKEAKQGAELIYSKDGWKIYRIDTYEAATYYGKNTKWCISGNYPGEEGRGQKYFNGYKEAGVNDYYFIISPDNHKWCYLDTASDFEESVLWDEADNGVTDVFDDTIPNFPEEAISYLPGFSERMITSGPIYDVKQQMKTDGTLILTKELRDQIDTRYRIINRVFPHVKKAIIKGDMPAIGNGFFYGCKELTEVYFEEGVYHIFDNTFSDCTALKKVHLPDSLSSIGLGAFKHCTSLEKIYIPGRVKHIESYAFNECDVNKLTIYCGVSEEYAELRYASFWNVAELTSTVDNIDDYVIKTVYGVGRESVDEGLNSDITLNEDKSKKWVVDTFSKQFLKYMRGASSPKKALQKTLDTIDDEDWDKVVDFVNSLTFPLTVYRGLKLENEDALRTDNLGVNWTIDKNLFYASNSAFKKSNYVLEGQVNEEDVDWGETIQNFIHYTLRPSYGFYAESEITLKKKYNLQNPKLYKKDENGLTFVKDLDENLIIEALSDNSQFIDSDGVVLSGGQAEYFKDSKVRDSSGNLLVCYHGTKDTFTTFKSKQSNRYDSGYLGNGFYFTDNYNSADDYAQWKKGESAPTVMSVYLNLVNPIIVNHKEWGTPDVEKALGIEVLSDAQRMDIQIDNTASEKITEEAKRQGYDGIIYHNHDGELTIVAFDANQIKSTDNREPTASDDINEGADMINSNELERTAKNALKNYSKFRDRYGNNDALFELKHQYHLTDSELVTIINQLIQKGLMDAYTVKYNIDYLGLEEYKDYIKPPEEEEDDLGINDIAAQYGIELNDSLFQKVNPNELTEEYKDQDWVEQQFKTTFLNYNGGNENLLNAKLSDISEGEWEDVEDYVNSFEFPLVIYRGLKLDDVSDLDYQDLGVNWTVDEELFFAPESAFVDSNYILVASVNENQIDWGETIQNYVYYSLRPQSGRWAESEVTLKPDFVLNKMMVLQKQGDELVPVQEKLGTPKIYHNVVVEGWLDNEERFWDYHTSEIQGNQVFDKTTQESGYGKQMIDIANSGSTDSKGRKATFVEMTPLEYFKACAEGFGTSLQAQLRQVSGDNQINQTLNDLIVTYNKRFPVAYLDYSGDSFGQEGRHRMFVAGERFGWNTKHPVLVIYKPGHKPKKTEVGEEEIQQLIDEDELVDFLDLSDLEIEDKD